MIVIYYKLVIVRNYIGGNTMCIDKYKEEAYDWYFKIPYEPKSDFDKEFIEEFVLDNYDRHLSGKKLNDSRLNQFMKMPMNRGSRIILHVRNPSEDSIICALKQNSDLIFMFETVTDKMRIVCVKKDGEFIKNFADPSIEVQRVAVRQDPYAIEHIKNPSQEILDLAMTITPKVSKLIPKYIIDGQHIIDRSILEEETKP